MSEVKLIVYHLGGVGFIEYIPTGWQAAAERDDLMTLVNRSRHAEIGSG